MIDNYESKITAFINENDLNYDALEEQLKNKGVLNVFNDITTRCLGSLNATESKNKLKTTSALVYLPKNSTECMIKSFNKVYVSSLYLGIICNDEMEFNYKNYKAFLVELFNLRTKLKKDLKTNKNKIIEREILVKIYIIKFYLNSIYGMLDNPESVITTSKIDSREYITNKAKEVILELISFFLNNSLPVYYVDTDEIFIPTIPDSLKDEAIAKFIEKNKFINHSISKVVFENCEDQLVIIFGKKRMLECDLHKSKIKGNVKCVKNDDVFKENKLFFGEFYQNVFPEYALNVLKR